MNHLQRGTASNWFGHLRPHKKGHLRTLERLSRSLQASHVGLQLPPKLLDMQGVSPTYLKEGGCEPCQNLNQPNGSLNLKSG